MQEGCVAVHRNVTWAISRCPSLSFVATRLVTKAPTALAEALKATHVIRFQNTRARHTFGHEERSSEILNAFDVVVKKRTLGAQIM